MEELELIAFKIISSVGTARSCYIEAIQAAKTGDYEQSEKLIVEGDENFALGHDAHAGLLTKEANEGQGSPAHSARRRSAHERRGIQDHRPGIYRHVQTH